MLEDDIYRTSTQYRLWSFTEESLKSIRANTNALASERVRAAIHRAREARQSADAGDTFAGGQPGVSTPNADDDKAKASEEKEIECLTPEEELELVQYYCEKALELGNVYEPQLPTTVRATAIQYLRRFYLTNSPMTYHPKSIMPCALFLATKTENYYMSLRSFTEKIDKATTEDIIAPEFLLTQGLRFTFDVRHPFRGLEGGIMELSAIAQGEGLPGPHNTGQTALDLQRSLQSLPPPPSSDPAKPVSVTNRIAKAHHKTREILKSSAQMTDAYFLYTPPQIWLAALLIADEPLANFYIDVKFGTLSTTDTAAAVSPEHQQALSSLRTKLTTVLSSCRNLLSTYPATHISPQQRMERLKRIGKKLYHCQNPEKADLVGLNRAQKRMSGNAPAASSIDKATSSAAPTPVGEDGGAPGDDAELQRAAKKRKLEREKFEKEGTNLFGGELVKGDSSGSKGTS
ncbi:hypothetical protein VTO42DRAFT_7489 [Malbranchea cinnamomea]